MKLSELRLTPEDIKELEKTVASARFVLGSGGLLLLESSKEHYRCIVKYLEYLQKLIDRGDIYVKTGITYYASSEYPPVDEYIPLSESGKEIIKEEHND